MKRILLTNPRASIRAFLTGLIVLLLIATIGVSVWIKYALDKESRKKESVAFYKRPAEDKNPIAQSAEGGDLIRKTRVERGSDFYEHVFYLNGKEVARRKVTTKGVIEKSGRIPDGKVKFFDEYKNTYGEEHYRSGVKHGLAKTYYKDGSLKKEEVWEFGQLMTEKEYYPDGQLRFEGDYRDARKLRDSRETGIGKLYWKNGKLKYEWRMINSNDIGYKKSYDLNGRLRHAVSLDDEGNVIKEEEY